MIVSSCKLDVFPNATSATYIARLVTFCTTFALTVACISVGLTEVATVPDLLNDPTVRVLSVASSFIGTAIYGMVIFILPFGLGGLAFGYLIEHDSSIRNRTAGIGFVSGSIMGYVFLFAFVGPYSAPTFIAAASGALAGFVIGVISGSIRFDSKRT